MQADAQILISGAGPVGLTAALALARRGIASQVFERRETLNTASKASTFHPPTLEIIEEFGLLESMLEHGCRADRIQYRRISGDVFAEFDQGLLSEHTGCPYRIHLEQASVTPLLLKAAEQTGLCTIRFGTPVSTAGSTPQSAWIELESGERCEAAYVIGADGAHSVVREACRIAFRGSKYPGRVLRLIVSDDLSAYLPGVAPVSYLFADDNRSISLLKMSTCWRVIIRVPDGMSDEEVSDPQWYGGILREFIPRCKGSLTLVGSDIYSASKMIADQFSLGRILLAGDAAHLTNTRGGMNMNCGIHDAYALAEALTHAIETDDPSYVTRAAAERHRVAAEHLLPRTDRNVSGKDDWLSQVTRMAADDNKARAYLVTSAMLDMAPPRNLPPALRSATA